MTTPNLALFQAKLAADPALQEQITSLSAASPAEWAAAVAEIAAQSGHPVTAGDILQSFPSQGASLSDSELERVAGGYYGGADSFSKGLEKYYDDYVKKFGRPPPQEGY